MDVSIQIIEDDGDEDDDVIIIDDPNPKPPAQVVILFDSDDEDDDDDTKDSPENGKRDSNDGPPNKAIERVKKNNKADVSCVNLLSSDESDSNCSRANEEIMNKRNKEMSEWYEKYKSVGTKSPYYICPECLASLSTLYMIDRHIQARHPNSSHRFQKNHSKNSGILHVLSDSESTPPRKLESGNNKVSEVSPKENNCSTVIQRLKLTPLPVIPKKTFNVGMAVNKTNLNNNHSTELPSYIPLEMSPRSPRPSNSHITTSTTRTMKPTKLYNSYSNSPLPLITRTMNHNTLPYSSTSMSSKESQSYLPPLASIKPVFHSTSTCTSTVDPELCTTSRNAIENPLTVVIFSPNNNISQERVVKVNATKDSNKTQEKIIGMNTDIDDNTPHERLSGNGRAKEKISKSAKQNDYGTQTRMGTRNSMNNNFSTQGTVHKTNSNSRTMKAQETMVNNTQLNNHGRAQRNVHSNRNLNSSDNYSDKSHSKGNTNDGRGRAQRNVHSNHNLNSSDNYSDKSQSKGNTNDGRALEKVSFCDNGRHQAVCSTIDNGRQQETVIPITSNRRNNGVQESNLNNKKVQDNTVESSSKGASSLTGKPGNRKRKRDPLLILTDDDSDEQNLPKKRLKDDASKSILPPRYLPKPFTCKYCKKRFASFFGKKRHIQDKHTTKLLRPKPVLQASQNPPDLEKLCSMKHIVMIDIDNWRKLFESDLKFSPSTFVWAFHGGATSWRPSPFSVLLKQLQESDCFYLHPKCGNSKDAADFALCVQAGKLDVQLPKEIPFTVLSGDKGFRELQNQLSLSKREVHIVNPHHKTTDTVLTILNSIADR